MVREAFVYAGSRRPQVPFDVPGGPRLVVLVRLSVVVAKVQQNRHCHSRWLPCRSWLFTPSGRLNAHQAASSHSSAARFWLALRRGVHE